MARTLQLPVAMRLAAAVAAVPVALACLAATPASAQPATPASAQPVVADATRAGDGQDVYVGLGANLPLRWADAESVGVSGYIGFAKHHALRLNLATYASSATLGASLGEAAHSGRITDVGIGYQHYSRGLFDGLMLEVGVFQRSIDTSVRDDFADKAIVETDATGYAGRALVGWSWLWNQRLFMAAAVGLSVGRYAGTERTAASDVMPELETSDFVRYEAAPEGYIRFGLVFGN